LRQQVPGTKRQSNYWGVNPCPRPWL